MTIANPAGSSRDLFSRAIGMHLAGNAAAARDLYEAVLRDDPKHAHAYHSLGVIAAAEGRRDEAMQWFRQAIALRPDDAVFHHNLARLLLLGGTYPEALASARLAVQINPQFVGAWQVLAEVHSARGDAAEAARAVREVVRLQGETAENYNRQGVALAKESRLPEAVAAFRAGIACNPRGAGLYYNAGKVLAAQGHYADAVACLAQAASLEPTAAKAHAALSDIQYRKGDLAAALRARELALKLDPSLTELDFDVCQSGTIEHGIRAHENGELSVAELQYRRVLAADPVNADALHLLGVLLHQRGDHRTALDLIDRVVVRGNAAAHVHANRAAVLLALGDTEAAEVSCRRALALDPSSRGALANLQLVQIRQQPRSGAPNPADPAPRSGDVMKDSFG